MGETIWFGEDAGLAAAVGAVRVPLDSDLIASAGLAVAPASLFGDLVSRSAGLLPIVVIEPQGKLRARLLDRGAADVVPAAVDVEELAARLRAVRRRVVTRRVTCGDLVVDLVERRVSRGGRPLMLHPREFAVLACLAGRPGHAVSRAALYEAVWQRRFDPGTNVVTVTVSRLRAQIETGGRPRLVHTAPGGYRLGEAVAER